jgi:hypothetical protein
MVDLTFNIDVDRALNFEHRESQKYMDPFQIKPSRNRIELYRHIISSDFRHVTEGLCSLPVERSSLGPISKAWVFGSDMRSISLT